MGFEVGNAIFDVENGSENGGGNKIDGIGDAIDGFEGIKNGAGDG